MSCSSFWDARDLSFKSLPTLQDLLACCDSARFVRIVMDERVRRAFDDVPASPKRRRAAERKLKAALEAMCGLAVKKKANRSMILLPAESFVLHPRSGLIERAVSARLVPFACAPEVRSVLDACGHGSMRGEGVAGDVLDELPQPVGFALAPWEETLGTRVWMGGPWSCRERYLVLSSAFWEMTYYGFEYDHVRAAQARAKARLVTASGSCPPKGAEGHDASFALARGAAAHAVWYGLEEQDRFDEAYRDRLVSCVGSLNQAACLDFWRSFEALARRLGKG